MVTRAEPRAKAITEDRFKQDSLASKAEQHTLGRIESVLKIGLLAGFAIAQTAKIFVKFAANLITGGECERISSRFSLKSVARDMVVLTAIFQRIFTDGICGTIFAPRSKSFSLVETGDIMFQRVFLDDYHAVGDIQMPPVALAKALIINKQPSLKEIIVD